MKITSTNVLFTVLSAYAILMSLGSCSTDKKDEPEVSPSIEVTTEISIPGEGGEISIDYSIKNASEGNKVQVSSDAEWLIIQSIDKTKIVVKASALPNGTDSRTCHISFMYPNASKVEVTANQMGKNLPECPITAKIIKTHYYYADIKWITKSKETYISLVMPKSNFDKYKNDNELFLSDLKYYSGIANSVNMPLKEYFDTFNVFYSGDFEYEVSNLNQNKEYVNYYYTAHFEGKDLVRTSKINHITFKTKELVFSKVDFRMKSTLHPNRIEVEINPTIDSIFYLVDLYPIEKFNSFKKPEDALRNMIMEKNKLRIMAHSTWDKVCLKGKNTQSFTNLMPGKQYKLMAVGVDEGIPISNYQLKDVSTPLTNETDNATFTINARNINTDNFDIEVTPSKKDIRYCIAVEESAKIKTENDYKKLATRLLYNMEYYENVDWNGNDKRILHGNQTINTNGNILNPRLLKANTDYTILVFGINNKGEISTKISNSTTKTTSPKDNNITINIKLNKIEDLSIDATFEPSDLNAKYHLNWCEISKYKDHNSDNKSFMEYWVRLNGKYMDVTTGIQQKTFSLYFPPEEYRMVFAFGYDGQITTDLFVKIVDMNSHKVVESKRIPKAIVQKYLMNR